MPRAKLKRLDHDLSLHYCTNILNIPSNKTVNLSPRQSDLVHFQQVCDNGTNSWHGRLQPWWAEYIWSTKQWRLFERPKPFRYNQGTYEQDRRLLRYSERTGETVSCSMNSTSNQVGRHLTPHVSLLLTVSSADINSARYLPAIGRFLIVVTFLEDALRIITQWSDQLLYLHDYRKSRNLPISHKAMLKYTQQSHGALPISF